MTYLTAILIFCASSIAMAQSSVTGVINASNGDLIIQLTDDHSKGPYDAATLWEAIKGTSLNKVVSTPSVEIKCNTLISEPSRLRFGSCALTIKSAKVIKNSDGYGAFINGDEGKELLGSLAGASIHGFEHNLAGGSLLISTNPQHGIFALFIKNEAMAR